MAKIKAAIACQGGGSQTAFTAGALKGLIEASTEDFQVVSISGTSGGALCATLVWYSYMKGETPRWQRLIDFWHDNTARDWVEERFNDLVIKYLRTVNSGMLPAFHLSPSSLPIRTMMSGFSAILPRKEFLDFPALLRKYIDFQEIVSWDRGRNLQCWSWAPPTSPPAV
jgi:NTE family protein